MYNISIKHFTLNYKTMWDKFSNKIIIGWIRSLPMHNRSRVNVNQMMDVASETIDDDNKVFIRDETTGTYVWKYIRELDIIIQAPDNWLWKIVVDNAGILSTEAVV